MKPTILDLIDQAYRVDLDDSGWYAMIAETAARLVPESDGAMAYAFDATRSSKGVEVYAFGSHGVPSSFIEATIRLNETTAPDDAARFYHRGVICGTVSETLRRDGYTIEENGTYSGTVANRGFRDTFGLTASSPQRRGVVINSPLDEPTSLHPRVAHAWRQAGVHLQAAHRLREALATGSAEAEAVIDADARVVHAEGDAQTTDALERLRRAARTVDRARSTRGSNRADEALDMWSGLVSGRWTLVETFESDGRRLFVAYPNELGLINPRALTARERDVVGYVVQGDSNKWIAYQLGVRPATVARHLSSSLRKLGLRHRNELIWLYGSINASGRAPGAREDDR